ncbi:type I-F CRISPR-associated protein Csy1 [Mixta tenebrionis]|uniref:Type I-F CRISPR-associated protein Csy1 n=1 Tax=Mixta tenebrionis TaxID=2562439 RepID=A0A506V736_9GAMM|nr:type I-F CRISPR-associated protein Csy1 [Mixta tenebrionis]TPW41465.1 type I-F CRISPR-associated protein Csy1 [Mixta tenebrionis]
MDESSLAWFIQHYINQRRRARLEIVEREAAKKIASLKSEAEIERQRLKLMEEQADIAERYQPQAWLTDAARRAAQIALVTHAIKFTHSDAKGSNIYYEPDEQAMLTGYLSTASLTRRNIDISGNAAALDVAKLLQTEHCGDSLIAALQRNDDSALRFFARDDRQCASWAQGFKSVLENSAPASHKRAKQVYFPVGEKRWHLLSPLFATSLAHAVQQRISDARFSEESKAIREALKAKKWHEKPRIFFNDTAVVNFGGTKPQNISFLNSVRGGKAFLLSCASPRWQSSRRLPLKQASIFNRKGDITYLTKTPVAQLKNYLLTVKTNTARDRQQINLYIDTIIDIIFNYVVILQNDEEIAGWTRREDCCLKRACQLWLDPRRALSDEAFRQEREAKAWKDSIAWDFAYWLNAQLKDEQLTVGEAEHREWRTKPLFKARMRECEKMLREVLA